MRENPDGSLSAWIIPEQPNIRPQEIPGVGMALYHQENVRMPLVEISGEPRKYETVKSISWSSYKYPKLTPKDQEWFQKGPGKHKDWLSHCPDEEADSVPEDMLSGFFSSGIKEQLLAAKKFRMLTRMVVECETGSSPENALGQLLQFEEGIFQSRDYREWLKLHRPELKYVREAQKTRDIQRMTHPEREVLPNLRIFEENKPGRWREYLEDSRYLECQCNEYAASRYVAKIMTGKPHTEKAEKVWSFLYAATRFHNTILDIPDLLMKAGQEWQNAITLVSFGKKHIEFRKRHGCTSVDEKLLNPEVIFRLGKHIHFGGHTYQDKSGFQRTNLGLQRRYNRKDANLIWEKLDPKVLATGWFLHEKTTGYKLDISQKDRVVEILQAHVDIGNITDIHTLFQYKTIPPQFLGIAIDLLKDYPADQRALALWASDQI
jgi:hypothetical protein